MWYCSVIKTYPLLITESHQIRSSRPLLPHHKPSSLVIHTYDSYLQSHWVGLLSGPACGLYSSCVSLTSVFNHPNLHSPFDCLLQHNILQLSATGFTKCSHPHAITHCSNRGKKRMSNLSPWCMRYISSCFTCTEVHLTLGMLHLRVFGPTRVFLHCDQVIKDSLWPIDSSW